MAWNHSLRLVLRGSADSDPEAVGYEDVTVTTQGVLPDELEEGSVETYAGGHMEEVSQCRWKFDIVCWPFKVLAQANDTLWQDYGDYLKLLAWRKKPYKWIWRAYDKGSASDPIPRTAADGSETFWNLTTDTPAGILPIQVVVTDGLPGMEANFEEGTGTVAFTLVAVERQA